jgi:S-phase kinase-associated protein 1
MAKIVSISLDEDDSNEGKEFPCINVETPVLHKVVEYCTYHETQEKMNEIKSPLNGETVKEILKQDWYADFCDKLDRQMMFDLVAAANYMDIKPLLDLSCLAVSIHIKGKSVEELQEIFNITPPQQAAAASSEVKEEKASE